MFLRLTYLPSHEASFELIIFGRRGNNAVHWRRLKISIESVRHFSFFSFDDSIMIVQGAKGTVDERGRPSSAALRHHLPPVSFIKFFGNFPLSSGCGNERGSPVKLDFASRKISQKAFKDLPEKLNERFLHFAIYKRMHRSGKRWISRSNMSIVPW